MIIKVPQKTLAVYKRCLNVPPKNKERPQTMAPLNQSPTGL